MTPVQGSGPEPIIIVVCGPGGAGKGTVVAEWCRRDPHLWVSQSWTTRDRRPGEDADAYVFATPEAFEAKILDGGFLEWVEFLDYRQGSPVPAPPPGCDVIFEIDVNGARSVQERYPAALMIYVDAPSREEQRARLRGRGDSEERVQQRVARADQEAEIAAGLGCEVIINHEVDDTVDRVEALLAERRVRR